MGIRAGVVGVVVLGLAASSTPALRNWSTYGGGLQSTNDARTGWTAKSAATVTKRWARQLDGVVYGPLLVLKFGKARRLFAVTEADTVYSLDAATGRVVWRRSLGSPITTPCGQPFGITSAPALDPAHERLYVVGAQGTLLALSLATGKPVSGWHVQLVRRNDVEYVWSSLRLVGSTIYAATSSYCDQPAKDRTYADGRLLAIDSVTHRITHTLDIVPGPANMGGIWGWGGVSVDPRDGTLYAATGNAQVEVNGNLDETAGLAERVLQLSPSLKVLGKSALQPRATNNLGDEDFGATPTIFQPAGCPPLVAANSKNGYTSVWSRGVLGVPLWSSPLGPTDPDDPFLGQPAWDAARGQLVVSDGEFGSTVDPSHGIVALRPSADCTHWDEAWTANIGGGSQPPPLVLGDVVIATTPTIGVTYGLDAATGLEVWSAKTGPSVAPVATDGAAVFLASVGGSVQAYAPATFTTP